MVAKEAAGESPVKGAFRKSDQFLFFYHPTDYGRRLPLLWKSIASVQGCLPIFEELKWNNREFLNERFDDWQPVTPATYPTFYELVKKLDRTTSRLDWLESYDSLFTAQQVRGKPTATAKLLQLLDRFHDSILLKHNGRTFDTWSWTSTPRARRHSRGSTHVSPELLATEPPEAPIYAIGSLSPEYFTLTGVAQGFLDWRREFVRYEDELEVALDKLINTVLTAVRQEEKHVGPIRLEHVGGFYSTGTLNNPDYDGVPAQLVLYVPVVNSRITKSISISAEFPWFSQDRSRMLKALSGAIHQLPKMIGDIHMGQLNHACLSESGKWHFPTD